MQSTMRVLSGNGGKEKGSGGPRRKFYALGTHPDIKPVLTARKCHKCGLYLCKNFLYATDGTRTHVGYFHRCGASKSGVFDGEGDFVRVGLDMKPDKW